MGRRKISPYNEEGTEARNARVRALEQAKQMVEHFRQGKQVYTITDPRGGKVETTAPERFRVDLEPGKYHYAVKEIEVKPVRHSLHE